MNPNANRSSLIQVASENLSRVDCAFCGGRLYTHHKPDCPMLAAQKRERERLSDLMVRGLRGTR